MIAEARDICQCHTLAASGNYRRAPRPVEEKVDFAAISRMESRAIQETRTLLGVAIVGQQEEVVRYAASKQFTADSVREISTEDFEDIFARFELRAHIDGALQFHDAMGRTGRGMPAGKRAAILTAKGVERIDRRGRVLGRVFGRFLLDRAAPLVASAFLPDGSRLADTESLVRAIRGTYAPFLDIAEITGPLEFAEVATDEQASRARTARRRGCRMKVRNQAQREKFLREFVPFSRRIRQTLGDYIDRVPILSDGLTRNWLQTEYTRRRSHAVYSEALADPLVVTLTWTSMRDEKVCDRCEKRDGITLPKAHRFWGEQMMPIHTNDRCDLSPGMEGEAEITADTDLPDASDIQVGLGGFDPTRLWTPDTLGRVAERVGYTGRRN